MASTFVWGKLILELRNAQGVTQRVLCEQTKVTRSTLVRIERGRCAGNIAVVERLLSYFGYDLEAIQNRDNVSPIDARMVSEESTV